MSELEDGVTKLELSRKTVAVSISLTDGDSFGTVDDSTKTVDDSTKTVDDSTITVADSTKPVDDSTKTVDDAAIISSIKAATSLTSVSFMIANGKKVDTTSKSEI